MLLAVLCVWLGCAFVFVSSRQQKLLTMNIRKEIAWPIFTVLLCLATYLFSLHYLFVVACLLSLANVMVVWLLMIFSQGHFTISISKLLVIGTSFSVVSYWLGG
ncbi:MAG: hypothetical protein QF552_00155 [Litorilituus sp.]|jgi:VIT1/CCC1 family predicted Fe2+/Mn2+ transporter|nr:hypothetical protein [Litorilituus sp.]